MIEFLWSIVASIVVSLISLIGILFLLVNEKTLNNILFILIGFATGGLLGGAFFHLLPEALEKSSNPTLTFLYVILGFIIFFILERYIHWRHCHKEGKCDVHVVSYLSLMGDGIHNLIDGMIIATSFQVNISFGLITTLAIILHEIPQEIGDFGVLVYGGLSKLKALFYNFLSALTAIIGVFIGYFLTTSIENFSSVLLPIAAGGFIYIAASDLVPELHKEPNLKKSTLAIITFIFGIILMYALKLIHV
ncbi:MAG: ZIP family metal transporter [Caldisericia bacterium]|jgi:zinc and cadmium transporter|nr:ZIP family metal transporter [Caldisericia bacterium]HOW02663.1 ZIP family metal transporter [Caldisericia bacterium]HXK70006.1 ZIP family metal transporter [Caldisericia bacterium]